MSDPQRQYPVACHKCQKPNGFPYQVRTLSDPPGHIEISLRCRDCGHEWAEIVSNRD